MTPGRLRSAPAEDQKLITCVLYRGGSGKVLAALHRRGCDAAVMVRARGSAVGDPAEANRLPRMYEKEIVQVLVPTRRADEIFELVFSVAHIDRPYGGLIYQTRITAGTSYRLPDVHEEAEENE